MLIAVPEELAGKFHWHGPDGKPYLDSPYTLEEKKRFHEFLDKVEQAEKERFVVEE